MLEDAQSHRHFFESFHVKSLSKWPLHSKLPTSPLAQSLLHGMSQELLWTITQLKNTNKNTCLLQTQGPNEYKLFLPTER
jgi:hypothetical protein